MAGPKSKVEKVKFEYEEVIPYWIQLSKSCAARCSGNRPNVTSE